MTYVRGNCLKNEILKFICGIIILMHKGVYASGFLYHLPSQQILLQQNNNSVPKWSLFGQKSKAKKDPLVLFQEAIFNSLDLKLPIKAIYPVYDYFNDESEENCFIFYAEIKQKRKLGLGKDSNMEWFTFKQTTKLSFLDQTRQDIIVAERVIKLKARNELAKITPPVKIP